MDKKKTIVLVLVTIVGISAVALFHAGMREKEREVNPFGLFQIFDRSQKTDEELEEEQLQQICFSGSGRCTVTQKNPSIELRNPSENCVNMVFTISDQQTGELIARTVPVAPGEYAYVDVVAFYESIGTYRIDIDTSTTDVETGIEQNGMHQEMEVTIK